MKSSKNWSRLDNAAKIFPPTSTARDTKVFRLVCELNEPVDAGLLQKAVEQAVRDFPMFNSILKKGLFWYYFEESDRLPGVEPERDGICKTIYDGNYLSPLFRVLYHGRRINLEVFHALADGSGAVQFFRHMVYYYLSEKYGFKGEMIDAAASHDEKRQDAFYKYYDKGEKFSKTKSLRAYRIRSERYKAGDIGVIEGIMPLGEALGKARELGVTLSEFFVAALICSIYKEMPVRHRKKPVVIAVPVDLRRFFTAQTARNFFAVVHVAHNFHTDGDSFAEVLQSVHSAFKNELTEENLRRVIGRFSKIENNPFIKIIPLQIKILCLKLAGLWAEGEDTASVSNIGKILMPNVAAEHIKLFSAYLSTKRPQIILCSYGDKLAAAFSSPLTDTAVQRNFFQTLAEFGISTEITSNIEQLRERGDSRAKV